MILDSKPTKRKKIQELKKDLQGFARNFATLKNIKNNHYLFKKIRGSRCSL